MMSAGLPVVEVWRENNLYDFSEEAMLLCKQTPESIAAGIIKIINDQQLSQKMSSAGQLFMEGRTLETETTQFNEAFNAIMSGDLPLPRKNLRSYNKCAFESSVVRPDIARSLAFSQRSLLKRIALHMPLIIRIPLRSLYLKLMK